MATARPAFINENGEIDDELFPSPEEMVAATRLQPLTKSKEAAEEFLTKRWKPLYLHPKQRAYYYSQTRFNVVPAGRRSGKTEIAKRRLIRKALTEHRFEDARYIAAAPTNNQAVRIYWRDLVRLVPERFILGGYAGIMHSAKTIPLVNGNEICVMGMDVPERAEGSPIAHILLDEYANMLERVWNDHISPALMDTQGTADLIGVPEGRNHYYERVKEAESDDSGEWAVHTWWTEHILPLYLGYVADRKRLPPDLAGLDAKALGVELARRELLSAQRRMDPLSYEQELRASFVTFQGRVYYGFNSNIHAAYELPYRPDQPLLLMFDFNVEPGVCAIGQEFPINFIPGQPEFTGIIDEVYIPKSSNTELVCKAIQQRYGQKHKGLVRVYGDATGAARKTAATGPLGDNDWMIAKSCLRPVFGERLTFRVPKANPSERARINAVNSRIKAIDDTVRLRVDPKRAPHVVKDFEGVVYKDGIDVVDDSDKKLTHLSDGIGYFVHREYPLKGKGTVIVESY